MGTDLSPAQRQELGELVLQNRDVISDVPGRTTVTSHEIRTTQGVTVRIPPYRVPESRRNAIRVEVERMLKLGLSRNPVALGLALLCWCPNRMEPIGSAMISAD